MIVLIFLQPYFSFFSGSEVAVDLEFEELGFEFANAGSGGKAGDFHNFFAREERFGWFRVFF